MPNPFQQADNKKSLFERLKEAIHESKDPELLNAIKAYIELIDLLADFEWPKRDEDLLAKEEKELDKKLTDIGREATLDVNYEKKKQSPPKKIPIITDSKIISRNHLLMPYFHGLQSIRKSIENEPLKLKERQSLNKMIVDKLEKVTLDRKKEIPETPAYSFLPPKWFETTDCKSEDYHEILNLTINKLKELSEDPHKELFANNFFKVISSTDLSSCISGTYLIQMGIIFDILAKKQKNIFKNPFDHIFIIVLSIVDIFNEDDADTAFNWFKIFSEEFKIQLDPELTKKNLKQLKIILLNIIEYKPPTPEQFEHYVKFNFKERAEKKQNDASMWAYSFYKEMENKNKTLFSTYESIYKKKPRRLKEIKACKTQVQKSHGDVIKNVKAFHQLACQMDTLDQKRRNIFKFSSIKKIHAFNQQIIDILSLNSKQIDNLHGPNKKLTNLLISLKELEQSYINNDKKRARMVRHAFSEILSKIPEDWQNDESLWEHMYILEQLDSNLTSISSDTLIQNKQIRNMLENFLKESEFKQNWTTP